MVPDDGDRTSAVHLCVQCRRFLDKIDFGSLEDRPGSNRWDGVGDVHDSCNSVLQSALTSCMICMEVLRRTIDVLPRHDEHSVKTFDDLVRAIYSACQECRLDDQTPTMPCDHVSCALKCGELDVATLSLATLGIDVTTVELAYRIDVYARQLSVQMQDGKYWYIRSSPWTAEDELRLLAGKERHTSGRATLALCKSMIRGCPMHNPAWHPTRLLRLHKGVARLVHQPEEPYVTLSHCWGTNTFDTLTPHSQARYENGVPITHFLPSFRDAMQLTLNLGLRHIWIDTFCIIQGTSDWDKESVLMHKVYANATFNIGATHASSPRDGIFGFRPPQFPRWARYGQSKLNLDKIDHLHGPLLRRGWVAQERYLCRGMLHFMPGVWWESGRDRRSEYSHDHYRVGQEAEGPGSLHAGDVNMEHTWADFVEDYTSSALTFPDKDKLRAAEGVMKRIEQLSGQRIVYGHPFQVRFLLWAAQGGRRSTRLPTWSWTSMDGELSTTACVPERFWMSRERDRRRPLATMVEHLVGSHIVCIGRLLEATFDGGRHVVVANKFKGKGLFDGEIYRRFLVLPIVPPQEALDVPCMLMLIRSRDGTYSRIGALFMTLSTVDESAGFTIDIRSEYMAAPARMILIG